MLAQAQEFPNTRWGKAHAWWLQLPDMDADRWCVMTALATYANEDGVCHPSQATLARWLKRSRPWVNRVIGELAGAGLIRKIARTRTGNAGTTSCEYRIVTHPSGLETRQQHVPGAMLTCHGPDTARHDDDTPCQDRDRNQLETKHNQPARSTIRNSASSENAGTEAKGRSGDTVPEDWKPSTKAMEAARALCPDADLEAHAMMFTARSRAKGYLWRQDCMDDAWLAWLAEDRIRDGQRERRRAERATASKPQERTSHAGERRFAAWAKAAANPKLGTSTSERSEDNNPWK